MMNMNAVRSEIGRHLTALLAGPLQSDEVIDSAPADTYLTGILWPQGAPLDAAEDDTGGTAGTSGVDNTSEVELGIPGYRALRPCSIGLTFAVDVDAAVVISLGETSRYVPTAAEEAPPTSGRDSSPRAMRWWKRTPLRYIARIPTASDSSTWRISEFELDDGSTVVDDSLALHIRRRVNETQQIFTVTLINTVTEAEDGEPRDRRCLFQAEVVARAEGPTGMAAIKPRPQPSPDDGDDDALTNALLYRHEREFAVGHGIAATWEQPSGEAVRQVKTAWLPLATVKGTSPEGHGLLKEFGNMFPEAFHAAFLGKEEGREKALAAMRAFADCYAVWIEDHLNIRMCEFSGTLRKAAGRNFTRCSGTLARIREGISVLETNPDAWSAFALANSAMNRQSMFPSKGNRRKPLIWRPFQLAFMLLVIPGLVDPSRPDRDCMDLLWFPTGGGKTEAYLSLTAFQIFLRRLTDAGRRSMGGVDVLMRYTLRLLTVQQFQRAAALISACDAMRAEDPRLGGARITLGLYVGGDATPNLMEDARKALQEERNNLSPKSTPRQLLRCPICGAELHSSAYRAMPAAARIDIVCEHADCAFRGIPLPVMTVDETIYAAPPSLLIGTIDKFAQIPRRTDIRQLFGLDGGLPPGLIIQDELHLISGPLGSMAGLYETVVDLLCTRNGIRPKIIGSTATIGQAERQVKALFDRSVLQFPPPGFDATDSFFAVLDQKGPDRIYIGVASAGRSPKFALQAIVAALLQSAEALRAGGVAPPEAIDPYWTCVAYFNSLRELGGAHVLMQDDVPRQMQFLASRLNIAQRQLEVQPVELSSRVSSRELPQKLEQLGAAMGGDAFAEPPIDTVLASNMISVGVDVPRLGLMVVNGQPKSTAEYIQASSRVGRGMPGLVVTLYNFGRPRDLSHFEHFRGYHAALYRGVEATSVTPWAPRARDKALHAVIAAVVRHLVPGLSGDEDAVQFDPDDPEVIRLIDAILDRVDSTSYGVETSDTRADAIAITQHWARRSMEASTSGAKLRYWKKKALFGRTAPHLMSAAEEADHAGTLAWPTPNSMREVEPSTAFALKKISTNRG
jgi:hypothetical protein